MHIFLIFLILCFFSPDIHAKKTSKNNKNIQLTDEIFPRTDPILIGHLYQMLKVIDLLFTKHNITYWIDGGTALGAVRHQGIIPWDDDVDLIFFIEDKERILALADEFASYGLSLKDQSLLIRLFPSPEAKYPYIDIAGYRLFDDGAYRFHMKLPPQNRIHKFYWLPKEIDSLVRIQFGPITVNAPNDMLRYLFTGYGKDCLEFATYQTPHGGKSKKIINQKVRIVDFSSAAYEIENPLIPLE